MFSWPRTLLAALLALVALAAPAGAEARFGGIDRSFGDHGIADLSYEPVPLAYRSARQLAVAPDGSIYVLSTQRDCAWPCPQVTTLIRLRPDGSRDWRYGGDGTVELPTLPGSYSSLVVDKQERPVVAGVNDAGLAVVRLQPSGILDPSFGGDGEVFFLCQCLNEAVGLQLSASGYLHVTLGRSVEIRGPEAGKTEYQGVLLVRGLTAEGALDPGFGENGLRTIVVPDSSALGMAARLPNGGAVIVGSDWLGSGFYVGRLGPGGGFDWRYLTKARRALTKWEEGTDEDAIWPTGVVGRSGGKVDVFGQFGSEGFMIRLRRDGGFDRGFGDRGVRRFPWTVDRTLAGPGGRVFVLGRIEGYEENTIAAWLGREGTPLKSFAGGRGRRVTRISATEARLALQPRSRPVLLKPDADACRQFCPPHPFLTRFTRWAPR